MYRSTVNEKMRLGSDMITLRKGGLAGRGGGLCDGINRPGFVACPEPACGIMCTSSHASWVDRERSAAGMQGSSVGLFARDKTAVLLVSGHAALAFRVRYITALPSCTQAFARLLYCTCPSGRCSLRHWRTRIRFFKVRSFSFWEL
jgi:hypothetical protein